MTEISDPFEFNEGLIMTLPYPKETVNLLDITAGKNIAKGPATYAFLIETEHKIPAGGKFRIIVPAGVGSNQEVTSGNPVKLLLKYK